MRARWCIWLAMVFIPLGVSAAEFDWSAYHPSKLGETQAKMCPGSEVEHVIDSRFLKIRAVVTGQGEVRSMDAGMRQLIELWQKSLGLSSDVASLYSQEIQVREEGHDYWLPIQTSLVESFRSEVRKGQRLEVFVIYSGCVKDRPVFLMTEFEAEEE